MVFFLELGKNINFPQGVKGESEGVSLFRAFYDLSSSKQAIQRFTGSKVRQPYSEDLGNFEMSKKMVRLFLEQQQELELDIW